MDLSRRRFSQIATTLGFSPGLLRAARQDTELGAEIAAGSPAAGSSVGSATPTAASPAAKPSIEPEVLRFAGHGWMPNNPRLPVLIYRNAIRLHGSNPAAQFETLFDRN